MNKNLELRNRKERSLKLSRLKELLRYDPESGEFTRLEDRGGARAGSVAGCLNSGNGYVYIAICGVNFLAHRLAFYYVEGYFPEHEIDHENGVRDDNRWKNLSHKTRSCNLRNSGMQVNNTSGIKGVCWEKARKKWLAQIRNGKKVINLGHYASKLEAAKARHTAELKYGYNSCRKQSSALDFININT